MSGWWKVRLLRWLGQWVVSRSPAQRQALAERLAPVAARLARKRVRVARANLRLCFPGMPGAGRDALLERTLVANLKGLLDACVAWYADTLDIDAEYDVVGLAHLEDAIRRGGVVILGGHLHGSELHMRAVRELSGRAALPMVRPFRDPAIDAELNARRRDRLGGVIARGDVRALCAVVRAGGTAVYTPDVNVRRRNVFAPFFGVPAATLDGLGTILRRAGGTIVPTFVTPLAHGRYRLAFERPLADFPTGDGLADACAYNAWLESRVREAPEAYDWGVKRFKTRPPGTDGVYERRL